MNEATISKLEVAKEALDSILHSKNWKEIDQDDRDKIEFASADISEILEKVKK